MHKLAFLLGGFLIVGFLSGVGTAVTYFYQPNYSTDKEFLTEIGRLQHNMHWLTTKFDEQFHQYAAVSKSLSDGSGGSSLPVCVITTYYPQGEPSGP